MLNHFVQDIVSCRATPSAKEFAIITIPDKIDETLYEVL